MTHTNHSVPPRATRSRRDATSTARRRHASNFADAVVAAYIHDISGRRRPAHSAGRAGDSRTA